MDIKQFLLEVCQEKSIQQSMETMLGEQAQDVGLLISQRVVNLPPQLLPPLYDALFDEVSWATEDEVDDNTFTLDLMANLSPLASSFFATVKILPI